MEEDGIMKFYYLVVVHEFCINKLSATYASYVAGIDTHILHYYIGWVYCLSVTILVVG